MLRPDVRRALKEQVEAEGSIGRRLELREPVQPRQRSPLGGKDAARDLPLRRTREQPRRLRPDGDVLLDDLPLFQLQSLPVEDDRPGRRRDGELGFDPRSDPDPVSAIRVAAEDTAWRLDDDPLPGERPTRPDPSRSVPLTRPSRRKCTEMPSWAPGGT